MWHIITIYFPTAATLTGNWDMYLIFLHTIQTCECGSTSRFRHLLAPFLVRRAFSGSFWCRTPVRNSDHDNIRINIMVVFLLDCRNIMITIMIVSLPCNVRICTIVKMGYYPMHVHTMMHEVPIIFHFHYYLIQLR